MRNATKSPFWGLCVLMGLFIGCANETVVEDLDDASEPLPRSNTSPTAASDAHGDTLPGAPDDASSTAPNDAPIDAGDVVTDAVTVTTDAGETRTDADTEDGDVVTDAVTVTTDAGETRTDADTEDAQILDAESAESSAPNDAAGCNPIGRWQVSINPQSIHCFRDTAYGVSFFIDVTNAACEQDIEISLDIVDGGIFGHFVGTITYHVSFTDDRLTGNAEIAGTITSAGESMLCETTATIAGVREVEQ